MTNITTAFLGAGNIAKAILGGFKSANPEARVIATDAQPAQLEPLPSDVIRSPDNRDAVQQADVVVLCVKPNIVQEICTEVADIAGQKLFISVAAGITTTNLRAWLGDGPQIIRCMPNTPALVGEGMTGLFADPTVTQEHRDTATGLMSAVGEVTWFDSESSLDTVTAVSGSGPAYFFLLIEAMQNAAVAMGLEPEIAKQLCEQTALGAATMARDSELDASVLRQNVTSPGGTTAAALSVFADQDFQSLVNQALKAAETRSKELSSD